MKFDQRKTSEQFGAQSQASQPFQNLMKKNHEGIKFPSTRNSSVPRSKQTSPSNYSRFEQSTKLPPTSSAVHTLKKFYEPGGLEENIMNISTPIHSGGGPIKEIKR